MFEPLKFDCIFFHWEIRNIVSELAFKSDLIWSPANVFIYYVTRGFSYRNEFALSESKFFPIREPLCDIVDKYRESKFIPVRVALLKKDFICVGMNTTPELQIRGGIEDNSKIILFLNENIHCDPSLEPSRWDGSDGGSQNMFYGDLWLIILKLSLLPLLIRNTATLFELPVFQNGSKTHVFSINSTMWSGDILQPCWSWLCNMWGLSHRILSE